MTDRSPSLTSRTETPFGTMFLGLHVDEQGKPIGFHIAPPQKLDNSSVGELIDSLSHAADALIRSAGE